MSLLLLDTDAPTGLFTPERGRLRIDGTTFRTEDNALWQWRGFSCFLLFLQYCRGESIAPQMQFLRAFGFNIPRVFGPLPWVETPDYRLEDFDFVKFDQFLSLLESQGLRCNFSVGHYPHDNWPRFDAQIDEIAKGHWNMLKERVNEPHVGPKPDPLTFTSHRLLTSYGLYKSYYNNPSVMPPVLDFGTIHIQRDSAWHRKARHAQEMQHATNKPWISDEPAKMTEPGFEYPGGKNDPGETPIEMAWHAGVCCLWTPGCTVHTEEGKWGRVPQPGMLQYSVCEVVRDDVWKQVDASWQTGEYNRGGNGDSPVDNAFTEQNQIWTYSSLHPDRALSVRCGHIPLKATDGWHITEAWCDGTMATLERS